MNGSYWMNGNCHPRQNWEGHENIKGACRKGEPLINPLPVSFARSLKVLNSYPIGRASVGRLSLSFEYLRSKEIGSRDTGARVDVGHPWHSSQPLFLEVKTPWVFPVDLTLSYWK
ncbi:hypothetical protein ACFE04_019643 [Oxalis oulophora]